MTTPHHHTQRAHVWTTVSDLHTRLNSPHPPRILDVRWQLGRNDGRERYEAGHIPGALYADLDTQLAAPASPEAGRHPLPSLPALTESIRAWGITPDIPVVVYDTVGGMSAARAWWLLRWAGLTDVTILDGGLDAWTKQGHSLTQGFDTVDPTTITLTGGQMPTITTDDAENFPEHGILLDARAPHRYSGEEEPIDPRAGHIPGALNTPTAHFIDEAGHLKPAADLTDILTDAGVIDPSHADLDTDGLIASADQPLAVYCGSGVTAAHAIAVLASLGIEAALYPGSWSQWSHDPHRPVATGNHTEP